MTGVERVVNVDGVDVAVGATHDQSDGSGTWSCQWCAVTGTADSPDAAYRGLSDHVDEVHRAEVQIAWRDRHPAPVVLDACPRPLRAWTAAMQQRYPDSILFVTLFGARITGVGETSSWDVQVDLRPSAPDGLDAQIRDDADLSATAPPEGVSLWFDRGPSRDQWLRLQAGWQRIAGWPERGFGIGIVSIRGPDDAYQWDCDLCGARGVVEIGSDGTRPDNEQYQEAARESAQRARSDQLAHLRETHDWSPSSELYEI